MLKIKGEQFERELKEKTCHIKPSLIGCCWSGAEEQEPQLFKVLQRYSAVVCTASPICLNSNELACDNNEATTLMVDGSRSEKAVKKASINETDVPSLIRILHGAYCSKFSIVKEFQAYLERNRTEDSPINPGNLSRKISGWWNWCSKSFLFIWRGGGGNSETLLPEDRFWKFWNWTFSCLEYWYCASSG